ncbi:MAG: hypothetical protein ABF682_04295 [Liquorilactobacillus sp.]|uniref:hypothetical protein n=1 Tax=Liquorilactobacillus TaxID=2767888 RepID=UPI0039ECE624
MTKNKLEDLNDHLFAELERLGDEDLKGGDLQEEIQRANAVSVVAKNVVDNADLALKAAIAYDKREDVNMLIPKMIGIESRE